jgi:hypothetical protein
MPNHHANYQNYAIDASTCRAQVRIVRTQEGAVMPLVRIDVSKTASRERVRDVGDARTAGEWTAAEASTLPSPTDARS